MDNKNEIFFIVNFIKTKVDKKGDVINDNPLNLYFDVFKENKKEILKNLIDGDNPIELALKFSWCWSWCHKEGVQESDEEVSACLEFGGLFTFIEMGIPNGEMPELKLSIMQTLNEWVESSGLSFDSLLGYQKYSEVVKEIWRRYQNDKRFKMYFDAAKAGNYL